MDINYPNDNLPKLPPFKFGPWIFPALLIMFAISAAGTIFYQVENDQAGVVQRFGKYVRSTEPGLHFKLPFGIESVRLIRITHVFKEEFGYRTQVAGVRTSYVGRQQYPGQGVMRKGRTGRAGYSDPLLEESMMLSGDLNVGVVEWTVQYKIKDPVKYAFRVRNPEETIRNMSEAVMRLVVGDHTINEVLTEGREQVQLEATEKLQELLDDYEAGISIRNVILQDVNPPDPVKPSFNEVNEARQEKEKLINQAWEEYNRIIPRAKGQAEQQIRSAEGYALERINRAEGDAERFTVSWEAYKSAPEVTRRRMYLETIQKVYPQLQDKILIDENQKGLLPFLDLSPKQVGGEA